MNSNDIEFKLNLAKLNLAKSHSRSISDTERSRLSFDFVFLVEREQELDNELIKLKVLYNELRNDLLREIREVQEERKRIYLGLRYGIIEDKLNESKASALTSLVN